MTTTCAVAAGHIHKPQSYYRSTLALVGALICAGLAGCGTSNILGGNSEPMPAIAAAPPPPQPAPQTKLALAPIVGAPEAINSQMATQLQGSLEKQRVVVVKPGDKADYTLRGYMVAAKEKTNVKVSYIWDLTDPAGKRANRIQGEEMVKAGTGDVWSSVSTQVTQTISDKTATSLAASIASLSPSTTNASAPVGVGAPPSTPMQTASLPAATAATAPAGSTRATAGTVVSTVVGAPGDGNAALTASMRQELTQSGLSAAQPGQAGYTVAGKVTVGAVKDGKQPVRIDWKVTDPAGATLATVTQNNDIVAGALDSQWGAVANDAAQGAAVKIKTLIEESQSGVSASRGPVRREVAKKT